MEPLYSTLTYDTERYQSVSVCELLFLGPFVSSPPYAFLFMLPQDEEQAEWKEMQLPPDTDSVSLQELSFGSGYQLEVTAVNANGSSSSATFNFTVGEQPGMHPACHGVSVCYTVHLGDPDSHVALPSQ